MKTLKIIEFPSRLEAEIAKSFLSSQGIESFLQSDDQGGMRPSLQILHGVSMWVNESDAKKAQQLLMEN